MFPPIAVTAKHNQIQDTFSSISIAEIHDACHGKSLLHVMMFDGIISAIIELGHMRRYTDIDQMVLIRGPNVTIDLLCRDYMNYVILACANPSKMGPIVYDIIS